MNIFSENKNWRFVNQASNFIEESPLKSFAVDDTLCEMVGQLNSEAVIRTWVHDSSVVLGIQDHRLPYLEEGMMFLQQQKYEPIVRNSGGLAVVLDKGVLNISLILSEQVHELSINDGYDQMVELIRQLFPEIAQHIKAYEIEGSYCPGSYDLSVGGRKFAGIAQRRIRKGVAVQIYLSVEGSGSQRAELIRNFYERALKNDQTKFTYPKVNPNVMASLSELIGQELTVDQVVQRIRLFLQQHSEHLDEAITLKEEESEKYNFYYERIIDRNKKMLQIKSD